MRVFVFNGPNEVSVHTGISGLNITFNEQELSLVPADGNGSGDIRIPAGQWTRVDVHRSEIDESPFTDPASDLGVRAITFEDD